MTAVLVIILGLCVGALTITDGLLPRVPITILALNALLVLVLHRRYQDEQGGSR